MKTKELYNQDICTYLLKFVRILEKMEKKIQFDVLLFNIGTTQDGVGKYQYLFLYI
jgi:hypothetical protein